MADRVKGKVALITGAAQGSDARPQRCSQSEGAGVVVADYNAEGGERTVRAIKEAGWRRYFTPLTSRITRKSRRW